MRTRRQIEIYENRQADFRQAPRGQSAERGACTYSRRHRDKLTEAIPVSVYTAPFLPAQFRHGLCQFEQRGRAPQPLL